MPNDLEIDALSIEPVSQISPTNELDVSAPLNTDKKLQGQKAEGLLDHLLDMLDECGLGQPRLRKRQGSVVESRRYTANVLIANLISLRLNRVNPDRYLAVPFSNNAYSLPMSRKAMAELRDGLSAKGLITVAPGFRSIGGWGDDKEITRLTRVRATPELISIFDDYEVTHKSVKQVLEKGCIRINLPSGSSPVPDAVAASGKMLERINERISSVTVALPDESWLRIRGSTTDNDKAEAVHYFGDTGAVLLRRVFKYDWNKGGRIYGGWWMHIPKIERRFITIDGLELVELDYAHLHPALLFSDAGVQLRFDPYILPEYPSAPMRELGKRTLQRLLNSSNPRTMRAGVGDGDLMPKGLSFKEYLFTYREMLEPISKFFGTKCALSLQFKDSELAVKVLEKMEEAGLIALPIHDSFLTQAINEAALFDAMINAYKELYGGIAQIKNRDGLLLEAANYA